MIPSGAYLLLLLCFPLNTSSCIEVTVTLTEPRAVALGQFNLRASPMQSSTRRYRARFRLVYHATFHSNTG